MKKMRWFELLEQGYSMEFPEDKIEMWKQMFRESRLTSGLTEKELCETIFWAIEERLENKGKFTTFEQVAGFVAQRRRVNRFARADKAMLDAVVKFVLRKDVDSEQALEVLANPLRFVKEAFRALTDQEKFSIEAMMKKQKKGYVRPKWAKAYEEAELHDRERKASPEKEGEKGSGE